LGSLYLTEFRHVSTFEKHYVRKIVTTGIRGSPSLVREFHCILTLLRGAWTSTLGFAEQFVHSAAMEGDQGSSKRSRSDDGARLMELLHRQDWDAVIDHVTRNPRDAATLPDPSPLALACRYGAPYACVHMILKAAPERIRHVLDSRGTPLHEAAVCEKAGIDVIGALLQADEALGTGSTRATLLQDVDGYTPLHLLIRRRFQSHILGSNDDGCLMEILELLVSSCPEAVVIPDRGEYEEPPIVYAIKATNYAPMLGSEEDTLTRVERQIFEMVRTMLKHAPFAAAQVFTGFRGQYTALHSAVFHGRCTNTIDLLLRIGKEYPSATHQKAALLTNTQLELPLHFWYVFPAICKVFPTTLSSHAFLRSLVPCEANDHPQLLSSRKLPLKLF
jgi:hypothetical protein